MTGPIPFNRFQPHRDEEPDLTPAERALTKVRLAVADATEAGASRVQIDSEVNQGVSAMLRFLHGGTR